MKNQKGFTLIELMVVIVIIGILAAVAIPRMSGLTDKAKATEVINAVGSFEQLQRAYYIEADDVGTGSAVGFSAPNGKFTYATGTAGEITATPTVTMGACTSGTDYWRSRADKFGTDSLRIRRDYEGTRTDCESFSAGFMRDSLMYY